MTKKHECAFKEKDFAQHIKNKCVICGTKIRADWENYQKRGNVCVECAIKTNRYLNRK